MLGERVAQRAAQLNQLLGEGIDLRVLGTGGFSTLLEQGVLESGQGLGDFLALAASRLADLATHFALQPVNALGLSLHQCEHLLAILRGPGILLGSAFDEPCQPRQHGNLNNGQQRQPHIGEFSHSPIMWPRATAPVCSQGSKACPGSGRRSGCQPPDWPWQVAWHA